MSKKWHVKIDRRFLATGEGEAIIEVPLDIKVEAAVGLLMCIIGSVITFTS